MWSTKVELGQTLLDEIIHRTIQECEAQIQHRVRANTDQCKAYIARPDRLFRRIISHFQNLVVILHSRIGVPEPIPNWVKGNSTIATSGRHSIYKIRSPQHKNSNHLSQSKRPWGLTQVMNKRATEKKKDRGGEIRRRRDETRRGRGDSHLGLAEEGDEVEVDGDLLPRPRRLLAVLLPLPPHSPPLSPRRFDAARTRDFSARFVPGESRRFRRFSRPVRWLAVVGFRGLRRSQEGSSSRFFWFFWGGFSGRVMDHNLTRPTWLRLWLHLRPRPMYNVFVFWMGFEIHFVCLGP